MKTNIYIFIACLVVAGVVVWFNLDPQPQEIYFMTCTDLSDSKVACVRNQ